MTQCSYDRSDCLARHLAIKAKLSTQKKTQTIYREIERAIKDVDEGWGSLRSRCDEEEAGEKAGGEDGSGEGDDAVLLGKPTTNGQPRDDDEWWTIGRCLCHVSSSRSFDAPLALTADAAREQHSQGEQGLQGPENAAVHDAAVSVAAAEDTETAGRALYVC